MPRRDARALLADILEASDAIQTMVDGFSYDQYAQNLEKRSAVERQLITVGEAVAQLRKLDPALASRLGSADHIVGFRNLIVHGYFLIQHDVVWSIVVVHLPALRAAAAGEHDRLNEIER